MQYKYILYGVSAKLSLVVCFACKGLLYFIIVYLLEYLFFCLSRLWIDFWVHLPTKALQIYKGYSFFNVGRRVISPALLLLVLFFLQNNVSKSSLKSSKAIDLHIKKACNPLKCSSTMGYIFCFTSQVAWTCSCGEYLTHFPSCPPCCHFLLHNNCTTHTVPLPISSSTPGLGLDDDDDNHWSHYRRLKRGLVAQRGGVVENGSTEPPTRPVRDGEEGEAQNLCWQHR